VRSEQEEREFLKQVGERLISVREAAQLSQMTPSYIRRMLRGGEIVGVKIDRDWFTTRKLIEAYLDRDRRPGPKIV